MASRLEVPFSGIVALPYSDPSWSTVHVNRPCPLGGKGHRLGFFEHGSDVMRIEALMCKIISFILFVFAYSFDISWQRIDIQINRLCISLFKYHQIFTKFNILASYIQPVNVLYYLAL